MLICCSKSFQHYKDVADAEAKRDVPGYDLILSNSDKAISSTSFMGFIDLDDYSVDACAGYCSSKPDCKSCE